MLIKLTLNFEERDEREQNIKIDPANRSKEKKIFQKLCSEEDFTPSQMIRKLIRDYIEAKLGPDWSK